MLRSQPRHKSRQRRRNNMLLMYIFALLKILVCLCRLESISAAVIGPQSLGTT